MDFIKECSKNGIQLSELQIQQFDRYAKLLIEWNKKMNLTAITDYDEIYEKHFFDSILPSFVFEMNGHLCDVGAGAGFPSIPLKIVYPNLKVTIVETLGKRITFLNHLVESLELKDVTCVHARAEEYALIYRESFDIVSARAVANLTMLSELCIPLVKKGGTFLAMKGSSASMEENDAKKAIEVLGCSLDKKQMVELSDGSKRVNLFYRKIKETPKKYPRSFAQIKKNPL